MTRTCLLAFAIAAAPLVATAKPAVGDIAGNTPESAMKALNAAGCDVTAFRAEGGKIKSKCTDAATAKAMDGYIYPKTGLVTYIQAEG